MPKKLNPIVKVQVLPAVEGKGLLVTYENGSSRRVHHMPPKIDEQETQPHGAGSFHDPQHHYDLLNRVEAMRQKGRID